MNNKNAMAADCSVCYEAISAETGSVQMSCSHTFHYSCITKWFESKKSQNQTQNCPCCRSEPPVTGRLPVSEAAPVAVFEWDVEEEDDESEDEEEEGEGAIARVRKDAESSSPSCTLCIAQ